jgi:protein CMS1
MGGEDLESDDEYLDQNWHRKGEDVEVVIDETLNDTKKRGILALEQEEKDKRREEESKSKKSKTNPRKLILETGRQVAEEGREVQAQFLWTCYSHAMKMKGEAIDDEDKFSPDLFVEPKEMAVTKYEKSMAAYLKSGVLQSFKRLKRWGRDGPSANQSRSPCVLIISVSALRSVAILKQLSSLNLRAAKLFAKHMQVSDQVDMLEKTVYPIAVGTPNRLLKLSQMKSDIDNRGALNFENTELVIFDCYEDQKKFTVCTLNDTAPDLMQLLHEAVLPEVKKRKNIKFGMF